jgi:ABC-type proline/glycine betaine transport system substrate-binding protein
MKTTLKFTTAALLGAISLANASSAQAADCGKSGTVTIAELTWLSAKTVAHVAQ